MDEVTECVQKSMHSRRDQLSESESALGIPCLVQNKCPAEVHLNGQPEASPIIRIPMKEFLRKSYLLLISEILKEVASFMENLSNPCRKSNVIFLLMNRKKYQAGDKN